MSNAIILREHQFGSDRSLVLLRVTTETDQKDYITLIDHPVGGGVFYKFSEQITPSTLEKIWIRRTMFNGRYCEEIVHQKNAAILDKKKIHIEGFVIQPKV